MHRCGAPISPPTTRTGGDLGRWTGAICVLAIFVGAPNSALSQDLASVNRELTDIEADTRQLLQNPVSPVHRRSDTLVEERLTDGELFLRLKDYLRAAIIFTDIVEHYPSHRAYPESVFLLGESLFLAGDYLGARARYGEVIDRASDPRFQPYVQRSLSRLIEIAIRTRDFEGVDSYFARLGSLPSSALEATTAYFRAKYLYNKAVPVERVLDASPSQMMDGVDRALLEQALQGFEAIPDGSPYSLQARYFAGAIYTLRGQYSEAITAFRMVLEASPATPEARAVVEQAYLALGRLYFESGLSEQAIAAYQAVPQTSPHFDDALYELAWTYIQIGDATRSERALELLSVAAPESPLNAEAMVLRGNLLARSERYEEADLVFDEIRARFGPIRDELDETRAENPDLHAYFRGIVAENLDDFDIDHFLPEPARRWVVLEGDYQRALMVLADLTEAKQLVRDTDELAERLGAVLKASNRLSMFTDLRRQRERTTGLRNRLAQTTAFLIELQANDQRGAASGELAQVRTERERLQEAVARMPVDEEDFAERDGPSLDRYRALEGQLQDLQVGILGLEARIVAARSIMVSLDPQKVDPEEISGQLASLDAEIARYEDEIQVVRRQLEVGRLQVGVGDPSYRQDDASRAAFADLVGRERALIGAGGAEFDRAYGRIAAVERQLNERDAQILGAVRERVSEMLRVVDEETKNLEGYRTALASLGGETVDVVGAIAALNFDRVRKRFHDLVLEADVGKIDVAWARREGHRLRIDLMSRERAREIQALDDEFRDVMDDFQVDEGVDQ